VREHTSSHGNCVFVVLWRVFVHEPLAAANTNRDQWRLFAQTCLRFLFKSEKVIVQLVRSDLQYILERIRQSIVSDVTL
jgi:hypothetical protein